MLATWSAALAPDSGDMSALGHKHPHLFHDLTCYHLPGGGTLCADVSSLVRLQASPDLIAELLLGCRAEICGRYEAAIPCKEFLRVWKGAHIDAERWPHVDNTASVHANSQINTVCSDANVA